MIDMLALQTILSGVVSGGGGAVTAFAAVFRNIKKRLTALEEALGNSGADGNVKTGLFLVVDRIDEVTKKLKKEIASWEEDPPEWLLRLINRAARSSSINLEYQGEQERMLEQRFRVSANNLRNVEESVESVKRSLDGYIDRAEYDRDARQRSEELASIREQLATANGLLRGIMTAMGYIDPSKKRPGV
jgi:hypothetical protein